MTFPKIKYFIRRALPALLEKIKPEIKAEIGKELKKELKEDIKKELSKEIKAQTPASGKVLVWAEESSTLNASRSRKGSSVTSEWSYGNGATGRLGLYLGAGGYLLSGLGFHAEKFAARSRVVIEAGYFYHEQGKVKFTALGEIELNGARDGGGIVNCAHKLVTFDKPKEVPLNVVFGFVTKKVVGSVGDARITATLAYEIKQKEKETEVSTLIEAGDLIEAGALIDRGKEMDSKEKEEDKDLKESEVVSNLLVEAEKEIREEKIELANKEIEADKKR